MSGTLTGKISTVSKDGRPHVAPIWFTLDDDDSSINVIFTTGHDSVKAMLRDSRVSVNVCVDDQATRTFILFSFVIVDGKVEIDQDPDLIEHLKWTTKIAGRYMGQANAEAYGKTNAVKGELLVRSRSTKIIAKTSHGGGLGWSYRHFEKSCRMKIHFSLATISSQSHPRTEPCGL